LAALVLVGLVASPLAAQPVSSGASSSVAEANSVVDDLVAEALASNLALRQEAIRLDQARQALAEARGAFLPSLDAQARYSRAAGGRQIDFPVGDLLNPVYGTLNDILVDRGQEPRFPMIDNVRDPFLRDPEQETQVTLRQSLFEPRVLYAYRARQHEVEAQRAGVEAFRRELSRDVKVAYFRYLQADERVGILDASQTLVVENRRTNDRLLAAGTVTRDAVLRAEAEVLSVAQELDAARAARRRARSYVNVLLNRPLDTPVPRPASARTLLETAAPDLDVPTDPVRALADAGEMMTTRRPSDEAVARLQAQAQARRAELDRLEAAARAAEANVDIARSAYLPGVSLAVTGGIQGTDYGFTGDRPFMLASVVLRWSLFGGLARPARVEQARLESERLRTRRADVAQQIDLQVQTARDAVQTARRALAAARRRSEAARTAFRLTSRRYDEGEVQLVTFLDARTTRTQADLNLAITRYDLLIRLAELEFAVGR
jgi:outer membrane protein TolC